jgi:2'-5' RNA ligase
MNQKIDQGGRTFLALLPPAEHHDLLEKILSEAKRALAKLLPRCTWVKPDQLHLTLHFYGDISSAQRSDLIDELRKALGGLTVPEIAPARLGAFPNLFKPRVIWIGLEPVEMLQQLSEKVERASEIAGLEREPRDFKAHITLCRIREPTALKRFEEALITLKINHIEPLAWGKIVLFDSRLSPQGPAYTPLAGFSLARSIQK